MLVLRPLFLSAYRIFSTGLTLLVLLAAMHETMQVTANYKVVSFFVTMLLAATLAGKKKRTKKRYAWSIQGPVRLVGDENRGTALASRLDPSSSMGRQPTLACLAAANQRRSPGDLASARWGRGFNRASHQVIQSPSRLVAQSSQCEMCEFWPSSVAPEADSKGQKMGGTLFSTVS